MKSVAILGATGHLATNIWVRFQAQTEATLYLFSRDPSRIQTFIDQQGLDNARVVLAPYDTFESHDYDLIVNGIGVGDPHEVLHSKTSIFQLTESFDNRVIEYLQNHDGCTYAYLSSGAVYGTDFDTPATVDSEIRLCPNKLEPNTFYAISKINAEAKHRFFKDLSIIDLRLFNFFSRYADLSARFFISELISCIRDNRTFETTSGPMFRDFLHPDDLFKYVQNTKTASILNGAVDICSASPISKQEILDLFADQFGLQYTIKDAVDIVNSTGAKTHYFSTNRRADTVLEHRSVFSSADSLAQEAGVVLGHPITH